MNIPRQRNDRHSGELIHHLISQLFYVFGMVSPLKLTAIKVNRAGFGYLELMLGERAPYLVRAVSVSNRK
ncbi:hypothetical protein [Shewanella canadensis]|uniref:hypothetical protein n=1 Tax=Shewanella canadensis TaxID=271096 RepID=UPI00163A1261|nr:hypothetical protein [Shewanella canadensis]